MGLFDKCYHFQKHKELMAAGFYPYFRMIESAQDTEVLVDNKKMLMLGSNSYMGLTNHPKVKEAAIDAIRKYGSGCAGSRFLNGTLDIHIELEKKLAEFVNKPKALCYTTGFQVNLGVISALVGKDDHVIIDKTDHASIIDGTRLSFGKVVKFEHNDMADLEDCLKNCEKNGKLIVIDGIYSMEGDIADLPSIVKLAKIYDAGVMVDDAHSIGVIGKIGNGTASHFGLDSEVDLIMGTFSKSLASIGGFIAGEEEVIDYLKHHSRALIFSASMTPSCAASVLSALDIIKNEPERRQRLWENTRFMQDGCKRIGFDIGLSESPIIPLILGDNMLVFQLWRMLHDEGIFVNPVVSPAVPPKKALIRISVMATHTKEQLSSALEILEKAAQKISVFEIMEAQKEMKEKE